MVLHSTLLSIVQSVRHYWRMRKNGWVDGWMGYQNLPSMRLRYLALRGCRMHLYAYPNNLSWNPLMGGSRQVLRILLTSLPGIFPESSPVWLLVKAHNFWNFFSLYLQFIEVINTVMPLGPAPITQTRGIFDFHSFSCVKYLIGFVTKRRASGRN